MSSPFEDHMSMSTVVLPQSELYVSEVEAVKVLSEHPSWRPNHFYSKRKDATRV